MMLVVGNTSTGRNTSAELLGKHRLRVDRLGKGKPASRALAGRRPVEDSRDYMASNLDTVKGRPRCQPSGACVHYSRTKACAGAVAGENDPVVAVVAAAADDSYFDESIQRYR